MKEGRIKGRVKLWHHQSIFMLKNILDDDDDERKNIAWD